MHVQNINRYPSFLIVLLQVTTHFIRLTLWLHCISLPCLLFSHIGNTL